MAITEEQLEIHGDAGSIEACIYQPESSGHWPGVIELTDIGGIRPHYREMAKRIAAQGFVVLVPNVFYRTSRVPVFEMKEGATEEDRKKRFAELAAPLTPEAQEQDNATYVEFLSNLPEVDAGSIGVVGFCFTGGMAMRMAALKPDQIKAAASFHGGGLYTDAPTSPHRVLPRVKAELYFGHAVKDNSMPAEAIEKLEGALASWGGRYESETYEGASHGWTAADSPVYNRPQAERAFKKLSDLFQRNLTARSKESARTASLRW